MGGRWLLSSVLLLLSLFCLLEVSHGSALSYVAAVVEHVPVVASDPFVPRTIAEEVMETNLDIYQEHITTAIADAESQGLTLQIILFPEDGLYGADFYSRNGIFPYLELMPDATPLGEAGEYSIPCSWTSPAALKASPILVRASCMAIAANVTLVLNMGELVPCNSTYSDVAAAITGAPYAEAAAPACPQDGRFQYNTQVAFAENGQLIGKYHKSHLFYERQFDTPKPPEVRYFDTSFGVRFGMLICFDVMFQEPQLSLYHKHGVRDFSWTSWWVNYPALITGTPTELARSMVLPSNFLASGIGLSWYNSGSGIYTNGTALEYWYNPTEEPTAVVLVHEVPMWPATSYPGTVHQSDIEQMIMDSFRRKKELEGGSENCVDGCCGCGEEVLSIATISVGSGSTASGTATSGNLKCSASFAGSLGSPTGLFGIVAITGMYNGLFPAQICALIHCGSSDCTALSLVTDVSLKSWSISGTFVQEDMFLMYPLVTSSEADLVPSDYYDVTDSSISSSASSPPVALLSATLFGLNKHATLL